MKFNFEFKGRSDVCWRCGKDDGKLVAFGQQNEHAKLSGLQMDCQLILCIPCMKIIKREVFDDLNKDFKWAK